MLSSTTPLRKPASNGTLHLIAALFAVSVACTVGLLPAQTSAQAHASRFDLSDFNSNQAIAVDSGSLTSHLYKPASFTPAPIPRAPERHANPAPSQLPGTVSPRNYPPLLR